MTRTLDTSQMIGLYLVIVEKGHCAQIDGFGRQATRMPRLRKTLLILVAFDVICGRERGYGA